MIAIIFCLCSACLRQLKVCIALTYFLFSFWFNLVQAQSSTSPPPAPSLLSAWPFSWPCYGWLPVWLAWPLSPSCLITIIFLTLLWLTSPMVTNEPSLAQAIKVMLLLLLWIFNHLWESMSVKNQSPSFTCSPCLVSCPEQLNRWPCHSLTDRPFDFDITEWP